MIPLHFGTFPPLTGRPEQLADLLRDLPGTEVWTLEPGVPSSGSMAAVVKQVLIVAALVLALRLPFLHQAIQGDDLYYLYGAEHAQIDPLHPEHTSYVFRGELVDMRGHSHPPLNSWILGGLLAVFGDVKEVPFHLVYIVVFVDRGAGDVVSGAAIFDAAAAGDAAVLRRCRRSW